MDYTVGSALQTQPYWTALNTGDDLVIASGSLSYPGLAASTGNKVIFDGSGIDAAKLFTQQTSGTVYYSFLLNVTGLGSLGTTGGYFSGFTEGTGNIFGSTIWTRQDGTGYDIGLNPRTTAANTVWSASPTVIDTTVFIVVSYQMVAGSNNDSVKMWINPAASSFGGTEPTYTLTATNTITDLANVNRILIRQDNATNTPFIQMDELRIGLTWADVTPPGISVPVDTQVAGVVGDQVDTCYNASDSIIVAGGITTFTVEPGGSAIMIAGQDIQYMPGTMVMSGGYMHGYITTTGTYCGTFAPTIVSKTMDAAEVAPEMEAGAFFKIYPNPTNDKIYLELDPAFRDTKTVVRIFGMVGDLIQQKEVMGNDHYEFSLGGKTPGIYFIRVMAGDRIDTKKIIKN
jgi:hypothetical protein